MDLSSIIQEYQNLGSFLVASNGHFLGKLSLNPYHQQSISNQYGLNGSPYSASSIFNPYSLYGSPYSSLSPFNPYTSTPPIIIHNGTRYGYLTKNPYLGSNNVDPDGIKQWMHREGLNY